MESTKTKDSFIFRLYRTKIVSWMLYSQFYFLKRELKGFTSVLDIGSGADSPVRHCRVGYSVGVDIFYPAIKESKEKRTHSAYLIADVSHLEFKPQAFDAVVLCEVLEHMDKDSGIALLKKAESWARKKVLVSSPNGYLAQDDLYGNPYQVHRCGWDIEEMAAMGYKAYGLVGLRAKPHSASSLLLGCWAIVSVLLEALTYYFPRMAFEVFYVKDITCG